LRAYIVVDLGFGDAGKGLLTDFLVRRYNANLVVRYNGGAQAGHNVVTPDGRHHTFSQFGSGTFIPHVKTYLSRHVVIHPTALLIEGDLLEKKGVPDPFSRLCVSDQALVITPFHQAMNRIRETVRGNNRHGSCGIGVGEAVEDALQYLENRILAGDLNNPNLLRQKLQIIREQKLEQIDTLRKDISSSDFPLQEYEIFEREDVINSWISSIARIEKLGLVTPDSTLEQWLRKSENVVFEGAQGVLLDADAGFHPYTTWSRSTTVNAAEIIKQMAPDSQTVKIGVMRSYAVRHGPGPLPTETDELRSAIDEHNKYNEWQGTVRYGWFDAVLTRYAMEATGGIDSLAVTHMDILPHLNKWNYCPGYKEYSGLLDKTADSTTSDDMLTSFSLPQSLSLEQRTQFTQILAEAVSVTDTCSNDEEEVIEKIETLTRIPIGIISRGPSAENVEILDSFPL